MNPLITKLLGKGAQDTIEAVSNVVDRYVSTPEEKEAVFPYLDSFHQTIESATWDLIGGIIQALTKK